MLRVHKAQLDVMELRVPLDQLESKEKEELLVHREVPDLLDLSDPLGDLELQEFPVPTELLDLQVKMDKMGLLVPL